GGGRSRRDGDTAGESDPGESSRQGRGEIAWGSEQALEAGGVYYYCARVELFHAGGEFVGASGCCRARAVDTGEHMLKSKSKVKSQKAKVKSISGLRLVLLHVRFHAA